MLLQSPAPVRPVERAVRTRTATWTVWAARAFAGLIAVFAVVTIAAGPSYAADGDRQVQGTLLNTAKDNEPVPGVTIKVTSSDGGSYTSKSTADGKFKIIVPAKDTGTLTVQLDTSTLPKGVDLRAGSSDTRKPTGSLTNVVVSFPIGADQRQVETKLDQVPQSIYNGLLFGIVLSLGALGLSMIFGTTGLTNFAHGELVTFGAIARRRPLPDRVRSAASTSSCCRDPVRRRDLGRLRLAQRRGAVETAAPPRHRPDRDDDRDRSACRSSCATSTSTSPAASTHQYPEFASPGAVHTRPDRLTPKRHPRRDQSRWSSCVAVILALQRTRLGKATRAVADNPALAAVDRHQRRPGDLGGLDRRRRRWPAWPGVLLGLTQGFDYQLGFQILLLIFAATVLGGLGTVWGAMVGASSSACSSRCPRCSSRPSSSTSARWSC